MYLFDVLPNMTKQLEKTSEKIDVKNGTKSCASPTTTEQGKYEDAWERH